MLAEEFTRIFRDEHRQVRDGLLELIEAFQARDGARASNLLGVIAGLTGPHFRYEEESLYPSLVGLFEHDYVEALYRDHDGAIDGARRLVELAGHQPIDDADVAEATRIIRSILPHVSDCDGLSIMVETLGDDRTREILENREKSLAANLDLITWADDVRARASV